MHRRHHATALLLALSVPAAAELYALGFFGPAEGGDAQASVRFNTSTSPVALVYGDRFVVAQDGASCDGGVGPGPGTGAAPAWYLPLSHGAVATVDARSGTVLHVVNATAAWRFQLAAYSAAGGAVVGPATTDSDPNTEFVGAIAPDDGGARVLVSSDVNSWSSISCVARCGVPSGDGTQRCYFSFGDGTRDGTNVTVVRVAPGGRTATIMAGYDSAAPVVQLAPYSGGGVDGEGVLAITLCAAAASTASVATGLRTPSTRGRQRVPAPAPPGAAAACPLALWHLHDGGREQLLELPPAYTAMQSNLAYDGNGTAWAILAMDDERHLVSFTGFPTSVVLATSARIADDAFPFGVWALSWV